MSLWFSLLLLPQLGGFGPGTGETGRGSSDYPRSFPDVLFILADDVNWDDLAAVETPHLAALAARGMTFRNHYAFPLCSPTRYALLFGRYPRRDGIGRLVGLQPPSATSPAPPLDLTSLPEVCRALPGGSMRSALIGKWHLGTNGDYDGNPAPDFGPYDTGALTPQLHGFRHFLAGTMLNLPQGITGGDYFRWQRVDDGIYSVSRVYAPRAQLDAFLSFWSHPGRRFALLAPNLPHAPLHDPPADWLPSPGPGGPLLLPSTPRQRFEKMLQAFDHLVGQALAAVDLERTLVFVLSDNGTQPGISLTPCPPGEASNPNSPGCSKETVWQGGIRVPLFVAGPGIPAGTSTDAVVSCADLMATVAEFLGVPSPGDDSISFAPVLRDPGARTRRIAFSEIFGTFSDSMGQPYERHELAAIGERYKLIVNGAHELLFDLVADPREFEPLPLDAPELAEELARLRAVIADPLDRTLQGG